MGNIFLDSTDWLCGAAMFPWFCHNMICIIHFFIRCPVWQHSVFFYKHTKSIYFLGTPWSRLFNYKFLFMYFKFLWNEFPFVDERIVMWCDIKTKSRLVLTTSSSTPNPKIFSVHAEKYASENTPDCNQNAQNTICESQQGVCGVVWRAILFHIHFCPHVVIFVVEFNVCASANGTRKKCKNTRHCSKTYRCYTYNKHGHHLQNVDKT